MDEREVLVRVLSNILQVAFLVLHIPESTILFLASSAVTKSNLLALVAPSKIIFVLLVVAPRANACGHGPSYVKATLKYLTCQHV